jgi:uncharacterized protein YegP (UPF0339 family)
MGCVGFVVGGDPRRVVRPPADGYKTHNPYSPTPRQIMIPPTRRLLAVAAAALTFAAPAVAQDPPPSPADRGLQFVATRDAFGNVVWKVRPNQSTAPTTGTGPSAAPAAGPAAGLTFEVYQDDFRQYRWRMKGAAGRTVAASVEGYPTKDDATRVIEAVMAGAKQAKIDDKTR